MAGRCFRSLSSASFKLCILFLSLSFALTLLIRLMTVFSGPLLEDLALWCDSILFKLLPCLFCLLFLLLVEASDEWVRLELVVEDEEVEIEDDEEEVGLVSADSAPGDWTKNMVAGEWTMGDGEQVVVATLALEIQQSAPAYASGCS